MHDFCFRIQCCNFLKTDQFKARKDRVELMEKRDELIENLEFLKSLDSKELVIYRKLKEIKRNGFDKKLIFTESKTDADIALIGSKPIEINDFSNLSLSFIFFFVFG